MRVHGRGRGRRRDCGCVESDGRQHGDGGQVHLGGQVGDAAQDGGPSQGQGGGVEGLVAGGGQVPVQTPASPGGEGVCPVASQGVLRARRVHRVAGLSLLMTA